MKNSLLTAAAAALALGCSIAPAAAAPADSAANKEAYWEAMGYGDCTKVELADGVSSYTLPTPPAGMTYTALILKSGSGTSANDVVEDPLAGVAYDHSTGKDLSHIIYCLDEGTVYPPS